MTFTFARARFIEQNGLKIIAVLGIIVFGIAGFVFYRYGVGTINNFQGAVSGEEIINPASLEEISTELDERSSELARLRESPMKLSDIFK